MPPLNSRSTGASRIARISSTGVRRGHAVGQPERGAHRLGDRDRLRRPRPHAAAGADPGAVVVRPRRALQPEEPLALGEGRRRVGRGVDEDVPVVERGHQPDVLGQQHPVAEDVAGHVADADDGEVLLLDVDVELAEVPGHRLPGAAGGDAHRLVVVADRPTGGERVTEPEAALERDGVGQVGEGRRPLVGRDDEVGVVAVVPDDPLRRHDRAVDQVVGQRQQGADEQLVAGLPLGEHGVAGGALGAAAA